MSSRLLAKIALLVTVFIWGTTFPATKVALQDVPPFMLTVLRFVLGGAVLLPLALSERRRQPIRLTWRELAIPGLVGGTLYFAFQNVGMVYTSASKSSLILASVPALTAVLSVLLLGERMWFLRAAGVIASILGVVVIIVGTEGAVLSTEGMLGDLLIVGSAISWPVYTILSKGLEGRATPALFSAATMGFGALFLLPLVGYELLTSPMPAPTPAGWVAIAYLGLVASAVTFLLWNYALAKVDASEAAVYINLVPVVAVASSVVFLGESVTPAHVLGGLLVVAGVWAASSQRARTAQKVPAD
ncbi:MAG: DMT family transporter [Dehalococcoidales bacterium]|nr:DMT family transporter [Dehalococcoidales bacterium]